MQLRQQLHFCYEAGPCGYGVRNGVDIADTALEAGAKTLIISGVVSALSAGIERHEFLSKPINPPDILAAVTRAIGSPTDQPFNDHRGNG